MQIYFFVPATKLHKIPSVLDLGVDKIIIDLEDAVSFSDGPQVLEGLLFKPELNEHFIRVPVINVQSKKLDFSVIRKLISAGFTNFMLPKLQSFKQFKTLSEEVNLASYSIILLVENPRLLMETPMILNEFPDLFHGICLGSHDYISETGGLHNLTNLEHPRYLILNYARMADILAIDIASMELNDRANLENEILDGFNKGYDAKLIIHPWQLHLFNQIQFYSIEDFDWAKKVLNALSMINGIENFNPVVINGSIVERPHLKRAEKIINWFKNK